MAMIKKQKITIFTLGHSTRSIDEFIELLQHYGITHIVDIRTIPRSRHNPQFNEDALSKALKHIKIKYTHLKELGGLRHAHSNSINTAWRNASFRGFADYMQTDEFKNGIIQLITYANHDTVAILCAEAVPWRCHRSLIGDALIIRGINVEDIFSLTSVKPHTLTPWAKVEGDTITYPDKS
jgi:uncharacterized protein (DUF488 family)